jgi:hypothetical protein
MEKRKREEPVYIRTSNCEEVLVLCLGGLDPLVVDDQVVGNHQLIVRIICNTKQHRCGSSGSRKENRSHTKIKTFNV